jgi:tripartite-type tricarboxylate transporter receptor subunit TctC
MRAIWLVFAILVLGAASANAADYPSKPIRLVVPFPPGGTLDVLARGLGPQLNSTLGQPIVIDNRAGANGVIGYDLVAKAQADGYTVLIGGGSGIAVHPDVKSRLPYDPATAFSPVGMLATFPSVLIANPSFPANSIQDLIAGAKASPGKISYGTPGIGNVNHVVAEWFRKLVGIDIVHAPYKGASLVVTDVIAGHIPVGFVLLPGALPNVRSGKIKALAVTGEERAEAAPTIPTMAQAGVAGLVLVEWAGIFAPAGTPAPVISRLGQEIEKAVRSPDLHKRWVEQGFQPKSAQSAEMAALMKSDIAKWTSIIRQTGVLAE